MFTGFISVSFLFFPLGIVAQIKRLIIELKNYHEREIANDDYLTSSMNTLAGLKAGILCSGMMIVVFLEMLRAVF